MRSRVLRPLLVLAVLGGACSSPTEEPGVVHIHGLGIDGETVYVATHFGLHVYEDGQWTRRSEDIADHMGFTIVSRDLMFRSGHPSVEMREREPGLGTNLGVQRSTDGGRAWETITPDMDPAYDFHAMTATRTDPPVVVGWDSGGRGVFRSSGDTWEPVAAEGLQPPLGALTATDEGEILYASTEAGLHRSEDLGDTWEPVSEDPVLMLATDQGGSVVFASLGAAVLRSDDGGQTWQEAGPEAATPIAALACTPDGRTVIAADQANTVWRSDDAGRSWSPLPPP